MPAIVGELRSNLFAAAGDWATLLPHNAELRGKIVRFLPG